MGNNSGTLVIAPVRPAAVGDTYPTAYANELLGGHKQVNLLTDRDAIAPSLREEGMTCWVIETGKLYVLTGGIADTNWAAFQSGSTTLVWTQSTPAAVWLVAHNTGQFPSVEVVDSTGALVEGDVVYVDSNNITLSFAGAFSGTAYLN
jgi:hypothetical protein